MALKPWNELPVSVRRCRKHLYNYIKEELEGEDGEDNSSSSEPATRDISITVNDGTDAVEGVSVAIGQITGTTGSAGGCTLQGVSDGEQTITATKEGYEAYSDTITVSENDTSFTISLTATVVSETPGET